MTLCCVPALLADELDDLATVRDRASHRASSHDRTGGNIDNITSFAPDATHVLLDTEGPGQVNHMWLTVSSFPGHPTALRDLVLRVYWENSPVPSVEAPLGDFFALGHGKLYTIQSMPVAVGQNSKALNCYWRMPFYKHAKIELFNNGRRSIRRIYYNIDYERGPLPPKQGLFHALFRHETPLKSQDHEGNTTGKDNYVLLETPGTGQYVGSVLFVDAAPGGWWGEGDEMVFIDEAETPTIIGTGSEDYFCNAWGYKEAFCYPYYGAPLLEKRPDGGSYTTVYRWHVPDPIRFSKRIRVTIERIFTGDVVNHYSSMAYWYQLEPIQQRKPILAADANHPVSHEEEPSPTSYALDGTQLEPELNTRGVAARGITTSLREGFRNGGYLRVPVDEGKVEFRLPVPEDGNYRVKVKFVNQLIDRPLTVQAGDEEPKSLARHSKGEAESPYTDLGVASSRNKVLLVTIHGAALVGIDCLKVEKVE